MPQNLGAALIVVLHDGRADDLRAAHPAADTDENDQILVTVRLHGRFHFVLGRFQFFLERVPFIVLGKFIQTVAAPEQVLTYSQSFGELDNVRADILDLLTVLCFDGDKSIGNQAAQVQRDLRPVAIGHRDRRAILAGPVRFARLFQRCEQFARRRNTDRLGADGPGQLVGRQPRGRCANERRAANQ